MYQEISSHISNSKQKKWSRPLPQLKHILFISLLFISLAFIGYLSTLAVFKIEIDSTIDDKLQIYWEDENKPFSEAKSKTTNTKQGRHTYWIFIPNVKKHTDFRIDPSIQQTKLKIHEIDLYSLQYFPVKLDLYNDSSQANQIEGLEQSASPYELKMLGNDPYIAVSPIQEKSPLLYIIFLMVITGLLFGKKHLIHGVLIVSGLLLFYFLLSFNETSYSFQAEVKQPEQVKLLWRDMNETFSKTRTHTIQLSPEKNHYRSKIGNISNIDVIALDTKKDFNTLNISNQKIKGLGFKEFNFSSSKSIVVKQGNTSSLVISIAIFLAFCGLPWCIFYFLKKKRNVYHVLFPTLLRIFFLFSSLLVFILAWQTEPNLHPDESAHLESVKYYSLYSDPPEIGDSRALAAYQTPWAISRLDDTGIGYFLAGKFRTLVHLIFNDDTFITRAFNPLLFMLFFVLSKNKRRLLFLTPLLCTPQIWYLFSYANRGAFVLFVSILLAWQLINKTSSLNLFLHTKKTLSHWKKVIYPGVLLGILSISQTNYVLFILFIFSILAWELLFNIKNKKIFLKKCLIFMFIGASIYSIRTGIDISINGWNKAEQRIAYAEEHAGVNFKPSIASTKESYSGLRLKDKGISYSELFDPEWDWDKMSFKSFVGFYGYYAEYSPKWYYSYVLLIYAVVFFVILKHALFKTNWQNKLFALISISAVFGGFLMSFLFCWTYDFQPQGRYMFPIIPILLVFFWKMFPLWNRHEKAIVLSSVIILSLLSFYSFYEVALNYLIT